MFGAVPTLFSPKSVRLPKPAVEEAQRGRHDHDEGRGRDDPRDVPGVQRQIPRSTELDGSQGTEPGV